MNVLYFLIAAFASAIGAISGIGGGVIIKPLLDSMGQLSVQTVSFVSSCTVLSMCSISLLRTFSSKQKIKKNLRKSLKTSVFKNTTEKRQGKIVNVRFYNSAVPQLVTMVITVILAIGAAAGGVIGKHLFEKTIQIFRNSATVGMIQTLLLLAINIAVLLFMVFKAKISTKTFSNPVISLVIGFFLGLLSSFLGIGGGPLNIIVLTYFYSMRPKSAVLNSLFIIFCSQITSLANSLITATVPQFSLLILLYSCSGGVIGALIGTKISKLISEKSVEVVFSIVLIFLILLGCYNFFGFAKGF